MKDSSVIKHLKEALASNDKQTMSNAITFGMTYSMNMHFYEGKQPNDNIQNLLESLAKKLELEK